MREGSPRLGHYPFIFALFFLLFWEQAFRLASFPGFHFDEAWAANFAFEIATKPGFWPLHAMSPYTMPWAHYIAAFFFRLFGANLFIFRASQGLLALGGVFFLFASLYQRQKKEAFYFLVLICLMPVFALNHRFAIELNGFHVLCFGLLFYLYQQGNSGLALVVAALGVSSHILFLAPCLALLGQELMNHKPLSSKLRALWIFWCLSLLPYFISIAFQIPEKAKAWSLVLLLVVLASVIFFRLDAYFLRHIRFFRWLLRILTIPFFVNLLFFSSGIWTLLLSTGHDMLPWMWLGIIMVTGSSCFLLWRIRNLIPVWDGFLLCVALSGLMMLKPAPRYFECSFLWLALLLAKSLATLPLRLRSLFIFGFFMNSCLVFSFYFSQPVVEKEVRVLFWKDNSRDFLRKQDLARALGLEGCSLSVISSVDSRVLEALRFLEHGDWPHSLNPCPWRELIVDHKMGGLQFQGSSWKKMEK